MKSDPVIERIKTRVAGVDPNGPRKVLGIFQLNIKAADGVHNYIVDLKGLKVSDGVVDNPDVTLNVEDEEFFLIGTKQIAIPEAVSQGKIEIIGDKTLANALIEKLTE
ncbi:uncharacterized protein LOC129786239 [Lutzomyia longipalpis]|uniref:Putative sterol carrier protein-2 n=1 Tax=Lutzomyia longipalpis TaxID=7200 RepID=A0A1B0C8N0_LUTLO|nr:uncharacterized protein LOC129786239 [Lutzomyia longipalpis]